MPYQPSTSAAASPANMVAPVMIVSMVTPASAVPDTQADTVKLVRSFQVLYTLICSAHCTKCTFVMHIFVVLETPSSETAYLTMFFIPAIRCHNPSTLIINLEPLPSCFNQKLE